MKLDIRLGEDQKEALGIEIIDLNSGKFLSFIIAADDSTGQTIEYQTGINGKIMTEPYGPNEGQPAIFSWWRNFEFVRMINTKKELNHVKTL